MEDDQIIFESHADNQRHLSDKLADVGPDELCQFMTGKPNGMAEMARMLCERYSIRRK